MIIVFIYLAILNYDKITFLLTYPLILLLKADWSLRYRYLVPRRHEDQNHEDPPTNLYPRRKNTWNSQRLWKQGDYCTVDHQ